MKSTFPSLLRAKDPIDLFNQVQKALANGQDLHTPLFSDGHTLCQFVVGSLCLYEYRLIDAIDADDLETQVQSLANLGFDFMFSVVQWNGHYLQWMARMNDKVMNATSSIAMNAALPNNTVVVVPESGIVSKMVMTVNGGESPLWVVEDAVPVFRGRFLES